MGGDRVNAIVVMVSRNYKGAVYIYVVAHVGDNRGGW